MIDCKYLIEQTNAYFSKVGTDKEFSSLEEEMRLEEDERYSALKYRLRDLKFRYQKALFLNEDVGGLEKEIETTEKEFEKIKALLRTANTIISPSCALCGDSGTTDGEPCICYYKKLNELSYEFLGVTDRAKKRFSDDTLSKTAGTNAYFSAIKKFVDKIPGTDKNVLIIGQKGTGKTFLTECAVTAVNEKKANSIYLSAFNLNNVFVRNLSRPFGEKLISSEILATCDLLAIDDLGTEPVYNKVTIENLNAIISDRLYGEKPFLINTNLELGEISERYGERFYSRLCGKKTVILKLDGKDLRFL